MTNHEPKPASTVLLCKITTNWPYKVLLLKRSPTAQFLPGAHVFPGGRVEELDNQLVTFLQKDQKNLKRLQQHYPCDLSKIFTHLAAAIRETLEESGISLLNVKECGIVRHSSAKELTNFLRKALPKAVTPCLDNIWPISWWVTPPGEVRRYNTWFFLATVNEQATTLNSAYPSDRESTEQIWLYPDEALSRYSAREIFLAPPTRSILERLAQSTSLDDFLCAVDQPLWPIHPVFIDGQHNNKLLVLPGDPLHHQKERSSMPLHTRYTFP